MSLGLKHPESRWDMRPRRTALACVAIALILPLAACSPTLPDRDPDIRGSVTSLERYTDGDVLGRILVEGPIAPDTGYDAASVSITDDTAVLHDVPDASPEPLAFEDLEEGMPVEVWFEGPVAESYPVQTTAGTVLVIE